MQVHEPVLALGLDVRADIERSVAALAGAGVPLDLVTYYDDLAEDVYAWVTRLPVAALSLDFCGVPGAAHGCATAALIAKHGFPKVRGEVAPRSLARGGTGPASRPPAHTPLPSLSDRLPTHARPAPPRQDKRLGAGIIDGRSIWRDDGTAPGLLAALRQALGPDQAISVQVGGGGGRNDVGGLGVSVAWGVQLNTSEHCGRVPWHAWLPPPTLSPPPALSLCRARCRSSTCLTTWRRRRSCLPS